MPEKAYEDPRWRLPCRIYSPARSALSNFLSKAGKAKASRTAPLIDRQIAAQPRALSGRLRRPKPAVTQKELDLRPSVPISSNWGLIPIM